MGIRIFFWFVFCLIWPLVANAASVLCKDIDGEFLFVGEWVSLTEQSTNGTNPKFSIGNTQPRPTLDRQAFLNIQHLGTIAPIAVRITFDQKNRVVKLLNDNRANSLPERKGSDLNHYFKCVNSEWQRGFDFRGSTSDSGRISEIQTVSLVLDFDGNLIANGKNETQVGSWWKTVVTVTWVAKFMVVK